MTNRKRAENVIIDFPDFAPIDIRLRQGYRERVEWAIDEAENRGFELGIEEKQKAAFEIGFKEGQREMRERAGMFLKNNGDSMAADAIRALPIEGEEKK